MKSTGLFISLSIFLFLGSTFLCYYQAGKTMALHVHHIEIDGQTAHVTARYTAVETNPVTGQRSSGQMETVGIDHVSLMRSFHGPETPTKASIKAAIMRWLEQYHAPAIARKRAIDALTAELRTLHDQVLFEEPVAVAAAERG
jgi:hypothetical protein